MQKDDVIYRQAAIDELPYLLDYDGLKGENGFVSKRLVRKMLKELPPAQPYYVTGYWLIRKWGDDAKCSNCGKTFKDVYDMENYDGFCRHCGTKMEGIKVTK